MRILLDSNILVSSLISPHGASAQLAIAWRNNQFELVTSTEQIEELVVVLNRPRVRSLAGIEFAQQLLNQLKTSSILVQPRLDINISDDPDDNLILGTALAGQVDLIVTGDKQHLLPLGSIEGIPIVTAVEALAKLASHSSPGTPQQMPENPSP